MRDPYRHQPRLGIQGSVVAWQDPWSPEASDRIMRTGTGALVPAQDPTPDRDAFIKAIKSLGAEFYVHHVMPGLEGQQVLIADAIRHGLDLCLGNEYGNINGPWVPGTNRYDLPDEAILEAAASGRLIGLLYDEPEHLQINAGQYRKNGWFPHWTEPTPGDDSYSDTPSAIPVADHAATLDVTANTAETWEASGKGGPEAVADDHGEKNNGVYPPFDRLGPARERLTKAVSTRVQQVEELLSRAGCEPIPLLSEQVFPTLFHTQARAGMALCPKIMKESFQPLQLAAALGAAKQYGRPLWICADLWGPDVGGWPTRMPGFPGHSPEEFASALRMGYLMGPSHLFVENVDALLSHGRHGFRRTVFGEIWEEFARRYVPSMPLEWTHLDADPDIVLIHSDDSNYGQNERPFGSLTHSMPEHTQSVFHAWHLLSHGTMPAHGSCMHIPGFEFPRHALKRRVPADRFPLSAGFVLPDNQAVHPLFYPLNNVLVLDAFARDEQLGCPRLIIVAGSSVSDGTLRAVRRRAEQGAAVIAAEWLLPAEWREPRRYPSGGLWLPTADLLGTESRETAAPFLGEPDTWRLRFGGREIRISKSDEAGIQLQFETNVIN